jgi:hypothetical protein
MAVTEILGTDSLSSSRVTLNDNFLDLQDEIQDLKALLDPQTNTLTGVDITANSITISGAPGTATLMATTATALTVTGDTDLKGATIKSGAQGTIGAGITTMPTTLADSTYFVDLASAGTLGLNTASSDGTEITLIATTTGNVDATLVAAATSIAMDAGNTLTLRFFVSDWYVIGSHGTIIT